MVLYLCESDCAKTFTPIKVGMRFPSSEVTITHSKKSEVRIANKRISHLHPLNKADGSARSDSHSFSQEVILTYFAPKWHCAQMPSRPNVCAQMSRPQTSCIEKFCAFVVFVYWLHINYRTIHMNYLLPVLKWLEACVE